jgi:CDP-4-dehydro-6-deoxyglucose reductase, E1
MNEQISYAKTVFGQDEIDAVVKCLNESTQMGKYSRKFETQVAALFEKQHCLYVNSGSSALYLGIEALELPPGSEVITPALTFSTTVGCLIKNSLVPVFVDVSPLSYCIDPALIEEEITDKTVAILAPNLLGNLCDWPKIREIANRNNLIVIEDSADTLGATINGVASGHFSDMSITSFYGSHIINCAGNGGALCVNDNTVARTAKLLRSWGRASSLFDENSENIENRFDVNLAGIEYDAKFVFEKIGYNLEGSEIGASFGLVQLDNLNKNISAREENFSLQTDFFKQFPNFFEVPVQLPASKTAWLAYPILISEEAPFSRREFQIYLESNNVQTRVVFTGNITKQPMLKQAKYRVARSACNNADRVMEKGVLLPVHHGMTDSMFQRLHSLVTDFVSRF